MAADGTPLIGGLLYFYLTGTSTPENTYSDQGLTIANTNPIVLDANGYAGSVFLSTGIQYKVVLTDANAIQQWTEDPVGDESTSGATFANSVEITAAADFTKTVRFQTNGVDRVSFGVDASPESGSNAGSNGALLTYSDSGVQIFSVFTFNRANGILDFSTGQPTVGGQSLAVVLGPSFAQVPTGQVGIYFANVAPSGWLILDGSLISRTTYAALWTYAQASGNIVADGSWSVTTTPGSFSTGDGSTTFRIPDPRGLFPRAWDDGAGVDSGRAIGTYQADEFAAHTHNYANVTAPGSAVGSGSSFNLVSAATSSTGGGETRPKNFAILFCIKT